jgi:hypothetical protein
MRRELVKAFRVDGARALQWLADDYYKTTQRFRRFSEGDYVQLRGNLTKIHIDSLVAGTVGVVTQVQTHYGRPSYYEVKVTTPEWKPSRYTYRSRGDIYATVYKWHLKKIKPLWEM